MSSFDVNELFKAVYDLGGSDLHVKYNLHPKMRKHKELVPLPGYEEEFLSEEVVANLAFQTMDGSSGKKDAGSGSLYGDYLHNGYGLEYAYEASLNGRSYGRWRISYYTSRANHGFVARLLQDEPKTLEQLNAHPTIYELLHTIKGIIFVTGATGSGKSTLMGAMVDKINTERACNIISLEDPIEMIHTDKKSTVIQRDVGMSLDAASYELALQSALRQDPDVILIGEIRSLETMKEAFVAANTGHLVITTLHTSSAAETVNRILKMYPADERDGVSQDLAAALVGIVSQELVKAEAGGVVAVNEILVKTREAASVIREGRGDAAALYDVIEKGERGSITFEQYYAELVKNGTVSEEVARGSVNDIERFEDALYGSRSPKTPSNKANSQVEHVARIDEPTPSREAPVTPEAPSSGYSEEFENTLSMNQEVTQETSGPIFSDIGEDVEFALDFSDSEPMKFNPEMISSEPSNKVGKEPRSEPDVGATEPEPKEQLILRLPKRAVKRTNT